MTKAAVPDGRYATVAIVLHWLTAFALIVQLGLAWRMRDPPTAETFAVLQLHKSVGITILILSLLRLAWRLANPPPPMPAAVAGWERRLARVTHVLFYIILIGLPLTGWIMVSTARLDIPTYLFSLAPWPHIPGLAGLEGPIRAGWNTAGFAGHLILAGSFLVLLPLHVAGALKYQLFSGDAPVLGRMAPGARPGRWAEPRLLAVLLGLAAAVATGLMIEPPRPAVAAPPAAEAAP